MKRYLTLLSLAVSALTVTGCIEDKPAPRLTSPDRQERIAAVQHAAEQYGAREQPKPETATTSPAPAPVIPLPAAGQEAVAGSDIIAGRWVVDSYTIDGFWISDERKLLAHVKTGTLWKLHADGTGEILGYKQRWTYDLQKCRFTISQEGIFFGFNEWITDAGVTRNGRSLAIRDSIFGLPVVITLKPE
jgi:hypothetical protein